MMTQSLFARKHQQQFVKLYSVQFVSSIGGLVKLTNESCPRPRPTNPVGEFLPATGRPGLELSTGSHSEIFTCQSGRELQCVNTAV